jgi:hypothetical protein
MKFSDVVVGKKYQNKAANNSTGVCVYKNDRFAVIDPVSLINTVPNNINQVNEKWWEPAPEKVTVTVTVRTYPDGTTYVYGKVGTKSPMISREDCRDTTKTFEIEHQS